MIFAAKRHGYTHFTVRAMETISDRGSVLTEVLKVAFKKSLDKYTLCKKTDRPMKMRNISFNRILSSFNDVVQTDHLFGTELTKNPTLHIIDVHSGYSETKLMVTREM